MAATPVRVATPQRTIMFTKTETEYNMKSIRFLLLTITAMFIAMGAMMMVIGISVYSHYHSFSSFYEIAKGSRFVTPSVLCTFVGLLLLVVSLFGFFGSLKRSTCMINVYALILFKIIIFMLVVIILAFTTSPATIINYLNIPVDQYPYDREVRTEIDNLQDGLNCCGGNSILDYTGLSFPEELANDTISIALQVNGDQVVMVIPNSCCDRRESNGEGGYVCVNPRRRTCKQAIADAIGQNASVLGVLGVSVMFILLLGVIFALLLARCIRKLKSERAMMAWKIREQLILARMEEDKKIDTTLYISPQESSHA